ncbi:uncharacterized protein LOC129318709 isoform X2 [Prosopis cineraria]|uniref:uncharacterized protein LOC129318709 isoform X2 n=1 Tax=Prosopis cineraria TaxID=364024 RepID=UPI002410AEBA|nr:uncharacterized protein LOC129318709 isoform X2 [Prosopis cineraria]
MELSAIIKALFSSLSGHASKFLPRIIKEQLCYFFSESIFDELEQSVKRLRERTKRVQRRADDESRNGKEIAADVLQWLKDVNDIISKNDKFQKDKDLPYTVYSKGFLPKPGLRCRLSRTASRLARKVDNLYQRSTFEGVSYGLQHLSIDFILSDIDFESFKSRDEVTEKINEMLKNSTIRMIGVHGPGGVGKTTLVKEMASRAQGDKVFDVVVFVSVTKDPDIKKIQGLLADQLGARLDDESEIGRASRLRDTFKKDRRNTLVVLDDLWAGLDLNMLGIPIEDVNLSLNTSEDIITSKISTEITSDGNVPKKKQATGTIKTKKVIDDAKLFKIVLTSRSREVLHNKMDVKESSCFSIEGLDDKEAEFLLKKVARVADKTPKLGQLAIKISKKCGGLPIVVVTIGRTLRNKNYSDWNDTLRQLEKQEFTEVVESVEFSTKLSFNHLESEELKSIFLLCAQLGYHPLIMDLVKYCIGLDIFDGFLTIKEIRERILRLIEKLKDSSLLLNSYSSDSFNMHDMIRDVALSIASKERHLFTRRNEELYEWPHKNEFRMHSAISVHNCDIKEKLPNFASCPKLKIFHVDSLDHSFNIPESFFRGMRELRALILTDIDLSKFLTAIGCLKNLRMLCLERCELGDISFIGELEKLRIVSLSGSKIKKLPIELGHLHKLQLLDISNCSELKEIPPHVLSRLNNLEELYMRNSVKWESEGEGSQIGNAILAELSHLFRLKNLDISISSSASVLPRNLFLKKLDSYKIVIGEFETLSVGDFKMPGKDEASRVLALKINENNLIHSQKGIKMLFRRVEKLLLGELKGVRDIFYELNLEGFQSLKQLSIINNSDIESIINSKELPDPKDVFPNLESLCLYKLKNMKKISYSKLTGTSFSKLKVVRITSCALIHNIFSLSMVKLLDILETIDVSDCDSMENIVAKEEHDADEDDDVLFVKLGSLALQNLKKFSKVYSNDLAENADTCLFNEQVRIPSLESLKLSSINMRSIWSSRSKPFKNLIKLNVEDCNEIEYIFSVSMAGSLENLKSMSVSGCQKMVKIFESEGINVIEGKVWVFPKLEEIHLSRMHNLTSIWPRKVSQNSFPSLNSVFIKRCKKLDNVFPSYMVGRFGRLESLKIVDCDGVTVVFDLDGAEPNSSGDDTHLQVLQIQNLRNLEHLWNKDPKGILKFKKLQSIDVTECRHLVYLFPVSVARGLQELDFLSVHNCARMEEVVLHEGLNASITFEFRELTQVAMDRLPELECFYKGSYDLKWPKLKKLIVNSCDKLEVFRTESTNSEAGPISFLPDDSDEIISNLEVLEISQNEAERLQKHFKNYRMNHLNDFTLWSCPSNEMLYWFIHRMPSLERLTLFHCSFRELIPSGSHVIQANIGTVVQLKYLRLFYLRELEDIGFDREPVLQCLESLYLQSCHGLINLAPSSVTLIHLISLEVHQCGRLRYLMGFSTAKSLVQLMTLKVIGCWTLKKIVAEQHDEVNSKNIPDIVFSNLMTLELVDLPKLSCFCSSEIHQFKFPSLKKLMVRDCPKMTEFCKRVTTALNLQVLDREEQEDNWYQKGDLNATIQNMVKCLPSFRELKFSEHAELEEIWHEKRPVPDNFFQNLRELVVENCQIMSNVIPSNLLPYLGNLERLQVRNCRSVVAIFDMKDMAKVKSNLQFLILDRLPNMKHVWNQNPQGILSFENLEVMIVIDCDCLQTVFPAATFAKELLELRSLQIKNCRALVEIVGKVEAHEGGVIEEFEFPRLTSVLLGMLPELKCFYSGRMKLRCPDLIDLIVYHCGKLNKSHIVTSEFQSCQGEGQIGASNDSQSFFSTREVISGLRCLSLEKEEAMMLCNGKIADEPVKKLKFLVLHCFHNVSEADELPFGIIHKLPDLEDLLVACSDIREMFPCTFQLGSAKTGLESLILEDLCNLQCMGLEHPGMDSLRQKLEFLYVERCPCLTKLVQSAVSFSNLIHLVVRECSGLEYLFTAATATSMRMLRYLTVSKCESIKEIVAPDDDGIDQTTSEVVFEKLVEVSLDSLPSLACFYRGSSTLKFPRLCILERDECPNLEFLGPSIDAPRLPEQDMPRSVNMHDSCKGCDGLC